MKGKFIVFEGTDGSGKSTQCKLFCDKLREEGYDVVQTREHTRQMIGELITKRLKTKANLPGDVNGLIFMLLFYADRVEHNRMIQKELENGKIVVSDRYYHSTLAYQQTQGFDMDFILNFHKKLIEKKYVKVPDIVFFVDIPAEEAMKRIEKRPKDNVEIFEHIKFLKKLRENYIKLKDILDESIIIVDGMGTIDEVQKKIWSKYQV